MRRREFLGGTAAKIAAAGLAAAGAAVAVDPRKPPNFVFFLIDDMGWKDVGFNGSSFFETPEIDKLAASGMRFTNAYAACPVCSPTRASIMTGKYPARLGITNFLPGKHTLPFSMTLAPAFKQFLPLEETTIAEELKAVGYTTAAIGKWHLGGPQYYPEKQGFDINIGGTDSGSPKSHFYPQWTGNPPIESTQGAYLADALTDAADDFIQKHAQNPFFLYFAHYGVHIPLEARKDYVPHFEGTADPKNPQHNPTYAAMVKSIDESVGRIVKRVTDLGIAQNTVFIFMSDNGGLASAEYKGQTPTSNAPLKVGKGFLYEGGIREPLCIVWPGVTKAGSVCNEPVISTDFYPTIAEMAGIRKMIGSPRDGLSLVPALKGGAPPKREALYWHYPHYSNQGGRPGAAIHSGGWKLIRWYENDAIELYNLAGDPGETTNLARRQPAKAVELRTKLDAWLRSMRVDMPRNNPEYDAEKETQGLGAAIREQLRTGELPTPGRN